MKWIGTVNGQNRRREKVLFTGIITQVGELFELETYYEKDGVKYPQVKPSRLDGLQKAKNAFRESVDYVESRVKWSELK